MCAVWLVQAHPRLDMMPVDGAERGRVGSTEL